MTPPHDSPHRVPVRWLSMHVPYACRHAGACCRSGWPIPLEASRLAPIERAVGQGTLSATRPWLRLVPHQPPDVAGVLETTATGRCVFHRHGTAGGCAIQHALGHEALPSACQHFPRACLIDPRGVSVTLSHYCPTAADLLFTHTGAVTIVDGPDVLPQGPPEGFDAREALPPLLTPRRLMDHDGYAAWEAHMVRVLAGADRDRAALWPEEALDVLERQARRLGAWHPDDGPLQAAIGVLSANEPIARDGRRPSGAREPDWDDERHLVDLAVGAAEPTLWTKAYPPDARAAWEVWVASSWPAARIVVGRLLAAHAFGQWMAYQGNGLLSIVKRLRIALAVLRAEALRLCSEQRTHMTAAQLEQSIRRTDLLLVHLADRDKLARAIAS